MILTSLVGTDDTTTTNTGKTTDVTKTTDTAKETNTGKTTDTGKTTATTGTSKRASTDIPDASVATGTDTQTSLASDDIPDAGNTVTTTKDTKSGTATGTNKSNGSSGPTSAKDTGVYEGQVTTTIDPRLPPGTITLKTPAATDTTYIKIGQFATLEWDYVSLSVTPKNLNIQAYCSYNSETYTIATNHPSRETSFIWDTEEFQANATVPLLTTQYTLQVYDSTKNMSAVAAAGYLSPFSQKFFMYSPQAYTPMAGKCYNLIPTSQKI